MKRILKNSISALAGVLLLPAFCSAQDGSASHRIALRPLTQLKLARARPNFLGSAKQTLWQRRPLIKARTWMLSTLRSWRWATMGTAGSTP